MAPGESGPYRALRDAGAVIVGVANMHELGSGSTGAVSVYGPAHNPWDIERCPGGSSSGPAAAVAGGLVAGAIGADGLGSIRYPGSYCGLTGLKPTFGRSAMDGHHIADVTDTIVSGPLCTDAGDARLLASVMFGQELSAGEPAGLRIGVVRDPFWTDSRAEVAEACGSALDALASEVGASVTELELPDWQLWVIAAVMVAQAEDAAHITPAKLNSLDPGVSPINRGVLKLRALIPSPMTARARRVRAEARRTVAGLFDQVDLLAWPTTPAVAPPLADPTVELPSGTAAADPANARHGTVANLTGIPGVTVPVGMAEGRGENSPDGTQRRSRGPRWGLPAALQLLGPWGADELLLDAAEALERATDREFVEMRPAAVA
jgi:Asp-tRNA(Asn)/Glu-tRNA(Gln) amidotransferase A subunit family amidase